MPRRNRDQECGLYNHVAARGSGRRQLFEEDADKEHFLGTLKRVSAEEGCSVFAWCLMDNHFHILLQGSMRDISKMMQRLQTSYAHWFNGRHGHVGHVFQGRYSLTPVETDGHFLNAVKYIHMNPRDMGIEQPLRYPWSSYGEYVSQVAEGALCKCDKAVGMLGGLDAFMAFHESEASDVCLVSLSRRRISDAEADGIAKCVCGERYRDSLALLDAGERRAQLARLRIAGLSVRQIERLTGIGRGVIARAKL